MPEIRRIARYFYKESLNSTTYMHCRFYTSLLILSILLVKTPSYTQRDQVYAAEETNYAQRTKTKRGKSHIQKSEQYRIKAERKKKIIGGANRYKLFIFNLTTYFLWFLHGTKRKGLMILVCSGCHQESSKLTSLLSNTPTIILKR